MATTTAARALRTDPASDCPDGRRGRRPRYSCPGSTALSTTPRGGEILGLARRKAAEKIRQHYARLRRDRYRAIVRLVCNEPGIYAPEIARALGLKTQSLKRWMPQLQQECFTHRAEVEITVERHKGYQPRIVKLLRFLDD
jgi:hypothetical protein